MALPFLRKSSGVVAAVAVLVCCNVAGAIGYFNLPGNSWQWCGHGFSGGYHAPFVLGPVTHDCVPTVNLYRQPYAPNPYACAPCYAGGGHQVHGANMQEPTILMPAETQEVNPAPTRPVPVPAGVMPEPQSSRLVRPMKY